MNSPKTDRELEGARVYKGPPCLARFARWLGRRANDRD